MDELEQIRKDLTEIKERNKRVELDKAWETSLARKVLVALLTYLVITLFFYVAHLGNPFVSSFVPTLGFLLSTLSIPLFKNWWMNQQK